MRLRVSVPVLRDTKCGTIANNPSADVLRMSNSGFGQLANSTVVLCPADLHQEIDALTSKVLPRLNDGLYCVGLATTQVAYEDAFGDVFIVPNDLADFMADGRADLLGARVTEANVRLVVTPVRFAHGLSWSFQVQPASHREPSGPQRLAGRLPPRGDREDGQHRPEQIVLDGHATLPVMRPRQRPGIET